MTHSTDTTGLGQLADGARNSDWLDRGAKFGLIAFGVVHLLVAWLALQLAFGHSDGAASQQGAMRELASQSFGTPLLWLVAIGLVALAAWQSVEAITGHTKFDGKKRLFKRLASGGKTIVYAALAVSAIKIAVGSGSSSNADSWTAKLMDGWAGRLLVGAIGLTIVAIGGYLVSRAVRKSFEDDLEPQATSGTTGTVIVRLGQAGYTAKGVALGIIGALFVIAAWNYEPHKAGGLDAALHTLLNQPFGPLLLCVVAVGIGCFGAYCFAWAKYADTAS